ncbi:B3 domain-containing transcription repressor VAL1 isoform X2 [Rhododendron vialii]|uniref:B3 domain-containing transcription repressor VAL1 isoform X2 n=1 Tax=Rhododendron vialii TaxID=182163 RepID=UPI00265F2234|nr:B3 domain-containing transcription repressor VAL1 isoform X2 [Rhododendron vialii]
MAKICVNETCQTTTTFEWKKGWGLKSGGFALLCYKCGSAYENSVYCETFHVSESGWRDCKICGKRIHCGCIASKYLHEYLDFGGVGCISCARSLETRLIRPIQIPNDDTPNGFSPLTANNISAPRSSFFENTIGSISMDQRKLMKVSKSPDAKELTHFPQAQRSEANASVAKIKREEMTGFPEMMQRAAGSSIFAKTENSGSILGSKDMYESLSRRFLNFPLGTPLDTPNSLLPCPSGVVEGREQNKTPPFQQGQRTRHILPKPPKAGPAIGSEANNATVSTTRVARPPAEGRGRHQLLPRYWPRITDQELQQISGDLNSNVVPLFEKVLSASDAGRIGRLVLPKACAEAYFPPISSSEGLPIIIQDVKGKEWTFQFRFWPNNNSRMYVLEGVTPCIQNMQLQAGDTVIFSRIEPGGKLVMGFRKSSNSDMQDSQTSSLPNGAPSEETSPFGVNDNPATDGGGPNEESSQRPLLIPEKKRSRNIGSKSKRLRMHSEDAMELRLTWAEAQELLRPPPSVTPTIVMIEDQEFEEYDEPPVFGKRTMFTAKASGEQEQWAQCDSCFKWRRLPMDVLLPPKWTCVENIWDSSRSSCSAPDEISPKELESLLGLGKVKKRKIRDSPIVTEAEELEPSGLDALATAAVLGDNAVDAEDPSAEPTTKHPRHRSGCTCIVCIQPPSGKGRHKSTCICNVCVTVRRRFKTLMLRRKKREAEIAVARGKEPVPPTEENSERANPSEEGKRQNRVPNDGGGESSNGGLDLNCDPNREDEVGDLSMASLIRATNFPVEYLRENGIGDLDLGPCLLLQAAGETGDCRPDEGQGCVSALVEEEEKGKDGDEGN